MITVFDNLMNGNLTEAKRLAAKYSEKRLANFAVCYFGYVNAIADAAAAYLKGKIEFQEYCDIEIANK